MKKSLNEIKLGEEFKTVKKIRKNFRNRLVRKLSNCLYTVIAVTVIITVIITAFNWISHIRLTAIGEKHLQDLRPCVTDPKGGCIKEITKIYKDEEETLGVDLRTKIRQAHESLSILIIAEVIKESDYSSLKPNMLNLLLDWAVEGNFLASKEKYIPIEKNLVIFKTDLSQALFQQINED